MKNLLLISLIATSFTACSSKETLVINDIPAKTTHVKADAPGELSYRGYPGAVYYDNYYYSGRYYNGYYYNYLGNGPLTLLIAPTPFMIP